MQLWVVLLSLSEVMLCRCWLIHEAGSILIDFIQPKKQLIQCSHTPRYFLLRTTRLGWWLFWGIAFSSVLSFWVAYFCCYQEGWEKSEKNTCSKWRILLCPNRLFFSWFGFANETKSFLSDHCSCFWASNSRKSCSLSNLPSSSQISISSSIVINSPLNISSWSLRKFWITLDHKPSYHMPLHWCFPNTKNTLKCLSQFESI